MVMVKIKDIEERALFCVSLSLNRSVSAILVFMDEHYVAFNVIGDVMHCLKSDTTFFSGHPNEDRFVEGKRWVIENMLYEKVVHHMLSLVNGVGA